MDAIVYTSNTGFTAEYARLLGEETGLPALSLREADRSLPRGSEILYLGWLMAGSVKGCAAAKKRYAVNAVCAVGMTAGTGQLEDVRRKNGLGGVPLFELQGGFDLKKLHGPYRFMMWVMAKTAGKGLREKTDRTPEEDDLLDLMTNGGSRVTHEALAPVLAWLREEILA